MSSFLVYVNVVLLLPLLLSLLFLLSLLLLLLLSLLSRNTETHQISFPRPTTTPPTRTGMVIALW